MLARIPFVAVNQLGLELIYALKQNGRLTPSSLTLEIPMYSTESMGTVISYPTNPVSIGGVMRLGKKTVKELHVIVLYCEEGLVDIASDSMKATIVCRGTSKGRFGKCYEVLLVNSWTEELDTLLDSSQESFRTQL